MKQHTATVYSEHGLQPLRKFLGSAFTGTQTLLLFIRENFAEIEPHIPSHLVSFNTFRDAFLRELQARRLIHPRLFQALRSTFQHRHRELIELAAPFAPLIPQTASDYLTEALAVRIAESLSSFSNKMDRFVLPASVEKAGLDSSLREATSWAELLGQLNARQTLRLLEAAAEQEPERSEYLSDALALLRGGHDAEVQEEWIQAEIQAQLEEVQSARLRHDHLREKEAIEGILERLDELIEQRHVSSESLIRWQARCRIRFAEALLPLQDRATASEQLAAVSADNLEEDDRARLVMGWLQLDEIDRAASIPLTGNAQQTQHAHQLLQIKQGQIPDDLIQKPDLLLEVSRLHLRRDELESGAARAERLLESAEAPILRLATVQVLIATLRLSLLSPDPTTTVPIANRWRLIQRCREELGRLEQIESSMPEVHQDSLLTTRIEWAWTEFNLAQKPALLQRMKERGQMIDNPRLIEEAESLLLKGQDEACLALLRQDEHPWLPRANLARMMLSIGRTADAQIEAEALIERWPGRAWLLHLAASAALQNDNIEQALTHARGAHRAFPGWGFTLQLAQALAANGHAEETWSLLQTLPDAREHLESLHLMAWSAVSEQPNQAPALWESVLQLTPGEHPHRRQFTLNLAGSLAQLGHYQEAADTAWQLRADPGLSLGELSDVLTIQRMNASKQEEVAARLREGERIIRERFPPDDAAESLRLTIHMALNFPGNLPRIDYQKLVQAEILVPYSIDEMVKMYRERSQLAETAWWLYRKGGIDFEMLCRYRGQPASELVGLILAFGEEPESLTRLRPPLPSRMFRSLDGQRLLLGQLELLLLSELELLVPLDHALGEHGRLVLFEDVIQSLWAETQHSESRAQRAALCHHEALLVLLQQNRDVVEERRGIPERRDIEEARLHGLPIIHHEPPDGLRWISPGALLDWIREHHPDEVSQQQSRKIQPYLAHGGSISPGPTLPSRLLITSVSLSQLHDFGLLEVVLGLCRRQTPRTVLLIERESSQQIQLRLAELRVSIKSAQRARKVSEFLGRLLRRGRVEKISRPEDVGLPDLPDVPDNEKSTHRWHEDFQKTLSWREALLRDENFPPLLMLSADSLAQGLFSGSGPVEVLKTLQWQSFEQVHEYIERDSVFQEQGVHLPDLVRAVVPETERRHRLLLRLGRLGFLDALGPEELLWLYDEHDNLSSKYTREAGWHRRTLIQDSPVALLKRAHFLSTQVAAVAIWRVWCEDARAQWSDEKKRHFTKQLLERLTELSEQHNALLPIIEDALTTLFIFNTARPLNSFVTEGNETASLSPESSAGRMWRCVQDWATSSSEERPSSLFVSRLSVLQRAIQRGFLDMAVLGHCGGNPEVQSHMGLLAYGSPPPTLTISDPGLSAIAILSSDLEHRPLEFWNNTFSDGTRLTWEALLQAAAEDLNNGGKGIVFHGFSADARLSFGSGLTARARLPSIAVLLRASPRAASSCAQDLIHWLGTEDGRLVPLLQRLARDPENRNTRAELALQAARSPLPAVQQDPLSLLQWNSQLLQSRAYPHDLNELKQLLSEPPTPFDTDKLMGRFQEGGCWHERPDQDALAWKLSDLPGLLGLSVIQTALSRNPVENLVGAWRSLQGPQNLSIGRLASSVAFLRVAAETHPTLQVDGETINLHSALPELLERLLTRYIQPPTETEPVSVESTEADLLSLCRGIIGNLGVPSSSAEGIWLTWRLYVWLLDQRTSWDLDVLQRNLSIIHQQWTEEAAPDLLDPLRFGIGRIEHRLLCLLFALNASDQAAWEFHGVQPRLVTSARLMELFRQLASRDLTDDERAIQAVPTPSAFPWPLPRSVPGLALVALLQRDVTAFLNLDPEVRVRWIQKLSHDEATQARLTPSLHHRLESALVQTFIHLTEPEQSIARPYLLALPDESPLGLMAAGALYDPSNPDPLGEFHRRLSALLSTAHSTMVATWYLQVMEKDFLDALKHLIEEALRQKLDPGFLFQALEKALPGLSPPARARAGNILRAFQESEALRTEPRLQGVFALLSEE